VRSNEAIETAQGRADPRPWVGSGLVFEQSPLKEPLNKFYRCGEGPATDPVRQWMAYIMPHWPERTLTSTQWTHFNFVSPKGGSSAW
jgi:hypothetical protein